jgi:putative methyltransferase (TIGR04325 family)
MSRPTAGLKRKPLSRFLPPAIVRTFRRGAGKRERIRFIGDFKSWSEAEKESTGYASTEILQKTRAALLKVKSGHAAFERDSMTFDVMQYEFPLLAGLLRAAVTNQGGLSVLDFGGSLGTTYFQSRKFLSAANALRWSVVDQPAHVACGNADFANNELHFYETISDCLREEQPNVLLLASVLQYLPEPYASLKTLLKERIPYVIVERTAFNCDGRDRLTVQCVPACLYNASYPAWFLSEETFKGVFANSYELICEYTANDKHNPEGGKSIFKGFQFQLKHHETSP